MTQDTDYEAKVDELLAHIKQMQRAAQMSAGIVRDKRRTQATGKVAEMCERIARQFDRIASMEP